MPYYQKFTEKYPTVFDLARAPEEEVLRLWQGLGYYSRGRNLHATARYIVEHRGGEFPDNHSDLLRLKGIGPYTAAAIASFAFGESVPAIDGNAIRVISRLFNIDKPTDHPATLQQIRQIANDLIADTPPDLYNQAFMEFGAMLCTPKNPACQHCPVQTECLAFPEKDYLRIPYKSKKTKVQDRILHYLVPQYKGQLLMKQRANADIWQHLFDFPEINEQELPTLLQKINAGASKTSPPIIHLLSHRKLTIYFTHCTVNSNNLPLPGTWYTVEEAEELPKPKVIADFVSLL